jgi:hypothetical protein
MEDLLPHILDGTIEAGKVFAPSISPTLQMATGRCPTATHSRSSSNLHHRGDPTDRQTVINCSGPNGPSSSRKGTKRASNSHVRA